ncbi:T9SS type A sorting domain-containing protein [Flavobacterium hibisci]|uniref:T9SS type A sorting domain-containing protein n=1 Tax=Flavobacterium hibisci TaxID=1914462 RepID=UPI001CBCD30F|nr:T9SS type A sorting domain-containing protein [Flavobacterium hibisci]MBZ4041014.1 T9SS type A sorting domain-containing protein [Flavobacterium hibisci]
MINPICMKKNTYLLVVFFTFCFIKIYAQPDVNTINNQTVCNGSSVSAINFSSPVNLGVLCGEANEGSNLTLSAPFGAIFTDLYFASYGNPTGSCTTLFRGFCHSANSESVVEAAAIGKNSFSLAASNDNFGDPCNGVTKKLKVQLIYTPPPVTYNWTNDNTSIGLAASGTGNIPSFKGINNSNVPVTSTITVTPTYGGASGQGTPKTFTITVNPSPKIVNQPFSSQVCSNEAISFTANVSNATNYQWQVYMGGSSYINISNIPPYSGANTPTLTISDTSTLSTDYIYRLVASGNCGSQVITNLVSFAQRISFIMSFRNVSCNGKSDSAINLTPMGGTAPYTTIWNDGITTEDRMNISAGTYEVKITDANGCTKSGSVTITQPNAVSSPTGVSIQSFNAGDNLGILAVNGQNIKWYATAQDAANYTNQLPSNSLLMNNTTYYATQSIGGCESRTSLAIKAYNPLLSVDDNIKSDVALTLYPNPVKDFLYFNAENKISKIAVFEINGGKVLEKILNGGHEVNVQSLVGGVYLIKVFNENEEEIKTLKFFKD